MDKVIVFGATGMIGEPVTKALIKNGFNVCITTRNTSEAQKKFPDQKIIKVDVLDPLSVVSALEGMEIVFICLSPERKARRTDKMTEREGIEHILKASKQMGIKRIGLVSSLVQRYEGMNGFHWWIFQLKIQAVAMLKSSGIPYSIFYPSSFMETISRDIIRGKRVMLIAGSVAKMWFISAVDFGAQVAKAFKIAGNTNQEYTIQGTEGFDWEETGQLILKTSKQSLKISRAPLWVLKFAGLFNSTANYGAYICEALNKYPEKFESEKTWNDLGKPTTTLQQYLSRLGSS